MKRNIVSNRRKGIRVSLSFDAADADKIDAAVALFAAEWPGREASPGSPELTSEEEFRRWLMLDAVMVVVDAINRAGKSPRQLGEVILRERTRDEMQENASLKEWSRARNRPAFMRTAGCQWTGQKN